MSITRTVINGDTATLASALATLVPDFFAAVDTTSGLQCKDADGNTIFAANQSVSAQYWSAYRSASSALTCSGQLSTIKPKNFYTVGSNGAVIELYNKAFVVIAKAKNGNTGIVLPNGSILSSVFPACWGDDTGLSNPLTFSESSVQSNQMTGNHTLFVPIPLYGTYGESNNFQKAFFVPMAQPDMRGVVQELQSEKGVYLTNGYVALLDDEQGG